MYIAIVIVISRFLERYLKAERTRAPAYSQAMRRIKGVFPNGFGISCKYGKCCWVWNFRQILTVLKELLHFCWVLLFIRTPCTNFYTASSINDEDLIDGSLTEIIIKHQKSVENSNWISTVQRLHFLSLSIWGQVASLLSLTVSSSHWQWRVGHHWKPEVRLNTCFGF